MPEGSSDPGQAQGAATSSRQRKIIHVYMDAFYASVEQRDRPAVIRRSEMLSALAGKIWRIE